MKIVAVLLLVPLGFLEMLLRMAFAVLMVCSIIGLFVLLETDFLEESDPACFKLARELVRS